MDKNKQKQDLGVNLMANLAAKQLEVLLIPKIVKKNIASWFELSHHGNFSIKVQNTAKSDPFDVSITYGHFHCEVTKPWQCQTFSVFSNSCPLLGSILAHDIRHKNFNVAQWSIL